MEDAFVIKGGKELRGHVQLSGAKNVALKAIIGALLFDSEVVLKNIPRIRDVSELIDLIKKLGAKAEFIEKNTLLLDGRLVNSNRSDFLHASKVRVSFMLFAPLLYKFKEAYIPNPGGCRIGARPMDRIIEGMTHLGITVQYNSETGYYHAHMQSFPQGTYSFSKPTHTGTELLILIAALADGKKITINNAALEPEIDDLIAFLNEGGAKIKRHNSSIVIEGVSSLRQVKPFSISPDRNEAATYAVLGLITKGEVTISSIPEDLMKTFNATLNKAGAGIEKLTDGSWRYFYKGPLKAVDIMTGPHPGFMTDWQPPFAVLMTQAEGQSIVHERVYENRFAYLEELRKLGADIDYVKVPVSNPTEFFFFNFDPAKKYNQAIRIRGPQKLHEGVLNIADLRAGATLALAALTVNGESIVNGASMLERGYEDFDAKITALGGDIKKV